MIGKIDEALFAEQGLAQTLSDNLLIQYELAPRPSSAAKFDSKKTISLLLTEPSTPIIFPAMKGLTINIWLLRRENTFAFREGRLECDRKEKYPIRGLLEKAFQEVYERREDCAFRVDNPVKAFHGAVIGPIVDLNGPEDDKLVIVSNIELCRTPWAAVIEWIKIRIVPSLNVAYMYFFLSCKAFICVVFFQLDFFSLCPTTFLSSTCLMPNFWVSLRH